MAVTIEFGGKSRELFFGLKEVKQLEAALPGGALGSVMSLLSSFSFTGTAVALYIGLKADDPGLNQNLVEKMVWEHNRSGGDMKQLLGWLNEAIEETGLFKVADGAEETGEGGEGNAPGRRRSRSGSSGRNPSASASSDSPRLSSGD